MRRAAVETAGLLGAACAAGLLLGALSRPPVPWRLPADFYRLESGARPLLLGQAARTLKAGGAIFLDIRPEGEFLRGHIAGAISFPADRARERLHLVAPWIEGVPAVLYGAEGEAPAADDLAAVLGEFGYRDLAVFVDGYGAWTAAGLPVETGRAGVLEEEPGFGDDDSFPNGPDSGSGSGEDRDTGSGEEEPAEGPGAARGDR